MDKQKISFSLFVRYPSVKRLPVHLENEQTVYIDEEISIEEALERAKTTELLAFFKYNTEHPETNVPYLKFPEKFLYDKKGWRIRKQGTTTIGRVYSMHPSAGEKFYLRMLLVDTTSNHSAGKNHFEI